MRPLFNLFSSTLLSQKKTMQRWKKLGFLHPWTNLQNVQRNWDLLSSQGTPPRTKIPNSPILDTIPNRDNKIINQAITYQSIRHPKRLLRCLWDLLCPLWFNYNFQMGNNKSSLFTLCDIIITSLRKKSILPTLMATHANDPSIKSHVASLIARRPMVWEG
jgi:hypothetical protein